MARSSMGHGGSLLNPSNAVSLDKKQNLVSSLLLRYQKVINTLAFLWGTRFHNLTMTLSGISLGNSVQLTALGLLNRYSKAS